MSGRRMIYEDMFKDDEIGMLPRDARLLWVGLIVALADDQGRLLDHLSLIKNRSFVFDNDLDIKNVAKWLGMLEEIGCIYRYKKDGKKLIQIVKWWDYQTPSWANESKFSSPDGWTDRVKVHAKGNKVKMVDWDKEGGFSRGLPKKVPTQVSTSVGKGDLIRDGDVNGDVNGDGDGESDVKDARSDFSAYQKVWENETGMMVAGFTQFTKMCERFQEVGVTPEIYRTAIREQKKTKYAVKRPEGVEDWAVGLVTPKTTKKPKTGETVEETLARLRREEQQLQRTEVIDG